MSSEVVIFAVLLLQIVPNIQSSSVHYLNEAIFENSVHSSPHFVLFYAPWCSHCKTVLPVWKELAEKAQEESSVKIAKVNCAEETNLCSSLNILAYPTMKMFNSKLVSRFEGKRNVDELLIFIKYILEKQAKIINPEVHDGLMTLTADSFDRQIKTGLHFVEFYAPWCVHCQRFAPTWKALAKAFINDVHINICQIDCSAENSKCQELKITGLPTLKLYNHGVEVAQDSLGRDITTLISYVRDRITEYAMEQADKDNVPDIPMHGTSDGGEKEKIQNTEKQPDTTRRKLEENNEKTLEQKMKEFAAFIELDDITIDAVIFEPTFVMFYIQGHASSESLYPIWVVLGKIFQEQDGPVIARLNCSKFGNTCEKYKVTSYPMLVLFKYEEIIIYEGEMDVESLKDFATRHHDEL